MTQQTNTITRTETNIHNIIIMSSRTMFSTDISENLCDIITETNSYKRIPIKIIPCIITTIIMIVIKSKEIIKIETHKYKAKASFLIISSKKDFEQLGHKETT